MRAEQLSSTHAPQHEYLCERSTGAGVKVKRNECEDHRVADARSDGGALRAVARHERKNEYQVHYERRDPVKRNGARQTQRIEVLDQHRLETHQVYAGQEYPKQCGSVSECWSIDQRQQQAERHRPETTHEHDEGRVAARASCSHVTRERRSVAITPRSTISSNANCEATLETPASAAPLK